MTKLIGVFASVQFDRIDRFDWTDPKSGQVKPIQKFVGLMEAGDGTREWVDIGFPRDPDYRAPQLQKGEVYLMPVLMGIDKKKGAVRLTIRTDMKPIPAPDLE